MLTRPFVIERRSLAAVKPRHHPKPDPAQQLREIAEVMRCLPRDCLHDPAELVILMRRLAGRLVVIANYGV